MMKTNLMFLGVVLAAGCMDPEAGDEAFDDDELTQTESALTPNLRVQIKSAINTGGAGLCLDIAGGGNLIGTPIVQFPCHRGPNQQWKIQMASFTDFQIQSMVDPTRCVGFTGAAVDNQLLRLAACTVGLDKPLETRFRLDGNTATPISRTPFRSVVTPANKCIDVASGLDWHSLWMQLFTCHNGPNQKWDLMHW